MASHSLCKPSRLQTHRMCLAGDGIKGLCWHIQLQIVITFKPKFCMCAKTCSVCGFESDLLCLLWFYPFSVRGHGLLLLCGWIMLIVYKWLFLKAIHPVTVNLSVYGPVISILWHLAPSFQNMTLWEVLLDYIQTRAQIIQDKPVVKTN